MALGKSHPDHLLSELTWPQMAEWIAFEELEPIGDFRADVRAGIVASTIANVNRGKSQKAYSPADFMPYLKKDPAPKKLFDEIKSFLTTAGKGK